MALGLTAAQRTETALTPAGAPAPIGFRPSTFTLTRKTWWGRSYLQNHLWVDACGLAVAGLAVFDVEPLPTHGGSLRVFAQRADGGAHAP